MDILKDKTNKELYQAILAESAKSRNEINTATKDIRKANGRIGFLVILANELLDRQKD